MAEGGGLLNRYTPQRRIEGSNPSVSARGSVRFHFESVPESVWARVGVRELTIAGSYGCLAPTRGERHPKLFGA